MRVRLPCRTDDVEGVNDQGEGGGKKDINDNGKIKHEDQDNKEKNSEAKANLSANPSFFHPTYPPIPLSSTQPIRQSLFLPPNLSANPSFFHPTYPPIPLSSTQPIRQSLFPPANLSPNPSFPQPTYPPIPLSPSQPIPQSLFLPANLSANPSFSHLRHVNNVYRQKENRIASGLFHRYTDVLGALAAAQRFTVSTGSQQQLGRARRGLGRRDDNNNNPCGPARYGYGWM
ncbi:hypothetical protein RRG08_016224 [Elysia crispata]|uniref:Uncharacterized protein n=1 Tax=Elysia crispata TaxID=231223 RepID=A0AAE0ZQE1_9GAST|nr:hypothetical protein RRG08_016224 [Elysia crispata]